MVVVVDVVKRLGDVVFRPFPFPDCLLSLLALASIFKLASRTCVLWANSNVSLAFVSAKVSRTLTTIEVGQRRGWVGGMSAKGKQEEVDQLEAGRGKNEGEGTFFITVIRKGWRP